jgi:hypothetical protein
MTQDEKIDEAGLQALEVYLDGHHTSCNYPSFDEMAAVCLRTYSIGLAQAGERYAICLIGGEPSILVEVLDQEGELYFQILSSRHPTIRCQSEMPMQVWVCSVHRQEFTGRNEKRRQFWRELCTFVHAKTTPVKKGRRSGK